MPLNLDVTPLARWKLLSANRARLVLGKIRMDSTILLRLFIIQVKISMLLACACSWKTASALK